MASYREYWPGAARKWDLMMRTRLTETRKTAERLFSNKAHYVAIQEKTGVPWYLIACLHYRESDASFSAQLAQGDPLNRVSTHRPAGMGPYLGPDAFERSAIEALEHDSLNKVIDWRLEKILFYAEKFNGFGYLNKGRISPYVWSGSSHYRSGKYVGDGVYDANEVDKQLGVAPLLKTLAELDDTIKFVRETPENEPAPDPTPDPTPDPIPTPQPEEQPTMGNLASVIPIVVRYLPLILAALPAIMQALKDWEKIKQASPDGVAAAEKAFKEIVAQLSAPQA